jgi:hypothetical protein
MVSSTVWSGLVRRPAQLAKEVCSEEPVLKPESDDMGAILQASEASCSKKAGVMTAPFNRHRSTASTMPRITSSTASMSV